MLSKNRKWFHNLQITYGVKGSRFSNHKKIVLNGKGLECSLLEIIIVRIISTIA